MSAPHATQGQHALELKAYQDKVTAQVEQVKAKLHELEAHFKGKKADAEIEAIRGLRTAQQDIEKKRNELKTVGEAKAAQIKAEIDAALANINARLEQLSSKVHTHSMPK